MNLREQNILFLTRTMGLGGTENVVLQLCEIFRPVVNKIVVCSCGGVNVEALSQMGIKHYQIPDMTEKNPRVVRQIYGQIRRIIKTENITVVHSHHRMAALYAELAAPKNMCKIANAHNTFQNKKRLTQLAYRNTKLIAVGEMVKRNLVEYFRIPSQQVSVIHNAVKPFDGNIQPVAIPEQERKAGHILIGNVGRLTAQKGMRYFIDAAAIVSETHPQARFFIVGDGEEKDNLQKLVQSKKLEKKVFFLGYRSDIQNVMSQLDLIVLSSLWEGLPLTPIEAYSVGKTVIGTAVDGTPEIIRDGVDGYLVERCNSVQLSDKMDYLLKHPQIREELERQAQKRYCDEFSFEKLKTANIELYKEIG